MILSSLATPAARATLQPFAIGGIVIDPPLTLAPMAGHTNYALRTLARELGGCGLVCTELLSSHALQFRKTRERALALFGWQPEEHPVAVQLFGSDPQEMAEAARIVADAGASIVDINMGCWVPKIAKKGAGAALLRDVCTATAVVEAVVKAVDIPVTVKVRSGYEDGVVTAVPFARAAAACGVQGIAVHARFAGQGHSGAADWDVIRDVKAVAGEMPVLGNGDVHSGPDAARMLAETGCDGVMIGRAALGQPWIFAQVAHYLRTGEELPRPSRAERARIALRHVELTLASTAMPPQQIILEMRGQISKYDLNEPGSVVIRNRLVRVESADELKAILEAIAESD